MDEVENLNKETIEFVNLFGNSMVHPARLAYKAIREFYNVNHVNSRSFSEFMMFLKDQAKRKNRLYDEGNKNSLHNILANQESKIEEFANSSASNLNVNLY